MHIMCDADNYCYNYYREDFISPSSMHINHDMLMMGWILKFL